MAEDKTSIGTWLDPEDLREFDETMKRRSEGAYSRSECVRNAMQVYRVVEEVLEREGVTFNSEFEKRSFVRQALSRELDRDAEK